MRSVNQNHHLYVVTGVADSSANPPTNVTETSPTGMIEVRFGGNNPKEQYMYFLYKGRDCVTRSDFIYSDQITYMKHIPASSSQTYKKAVRAWLDPDINGGEPIIGQDYVLNIQFQQFYGLSPENDYVKTVAVRATSKTDTAQKLMNAFVDELNASFSREVGASAEENPYLEFTANQGNPDPESDENVDIYYLEIKEKEQPWSLGKWEVESLVFDVFPSTIKDANGSELTWGLTTKFVDDSDPIPNNKKMADLEWFTFKERADIYGGMGYPNNFDFTPLVTTDTSVVGGYDAIEIHFAYQGSCEDIQKSEKDITLIGSVDVISVLLAKIQNSTGKVIRSNNETSDPGVIANGGTPLEVIPKAGDQYINWQPESTNNP